MERPLGWRAQSEAQRLAVGSQGSTQQDEAGHQDGCRCITPNRVQSLGHQIAPFILPRRKKELGKTRGGQYTRPTGKAKDGASR